MDDAQGTHLAGRRQAGAPAFGRYGVVALVVLAATLLALSHLAQHATHGPARPDKILYVARDITDAKTMDPGRFYEYTSTAMAANCYDTLLTFVGSDVVHPHMVLATGYTLSPDGLTYTFSLRRGIRFANGDRLSAQDVVFSYRRLEYLHDNPSFLMSNVRSVDALGAATVRISLLTPDASFLAALAAANFAVLDARVLRAHGGDDSTSAATRDRAESFLDQHSAGTGAFQLAGWLRDTQIVMRRNPCYWGTAPHFAEIIYQNQPNPAAQSMLIQHGDVDVAMNVGIDQAQVLRHDANVRVVTGSTLDLVYLGMNTSPRRGQALADPRVRRAIRLAIDYEGIVDLLLRGTGVRPNSMIPVGLIGNSPESNRRLLVHTGIAQARTLLRAAGHPQGFPADLAYATSTVFDGVPLDSLAIKIQHDLAVAGIHIRLSPQPEPELLSAYRAGSLQMVLTGWGMDYPDPSDFAGPFSPGGGPASHLSYAGDPVLRSLVAQADSTSNVSRRAALYERIQAIWLQDSPWIGLVQPREVIVLKRNLQGYVFSPLYDSDFRNLQ